MQGAGDFRRQSELGKQTQVSTRSAPRAEETAQMTQNERAERMGRWEHLTVRTGEGPPRISHRKREKTRGGHQTSQGEQEFLEQAVRAF